MTFGSMMASFASISSFAGIGGSSGSGMDYSTVPAQVSIAAQGGYEGNAYFALYTTNSTRQTTIFSFRPKFLVFPTFLRC